MPPSTAVGTTAATSFQTGSRTDVGESPHACGVREAAEEMGLTLAPSDLHLTGLVSEHGYGGQAHWLMFLFEVKPRLKSVPSPHREGRFAFFSREQVATLALPQTDREQVWPLFWRHRGGFFAAHCHCHDGFLSRADDEAPCGFASNLKFAMAELFRPG